MGKGIPRVRRWRVTFDNGTQRDIWAPTKRLAALNMRLGQDVWRPIKSIGLLRKQRTHGGKSLI